MLIPVYYLIGWYVSGLLISCALILKGGNDVTVADLIMSSIISFVGPVIFLIPLLDDRGPVLWRRK